MAKALGTISKLDALAESAKGGKMVITVEEWQAISQYIDELHLSEVSLSLQLEEP